MLEADALGRWRRGFTHDFDASTATRGEDELMMTWRHARRFPSAKLRLRWLSNGFYIFHSHEEYEGHAFPCHGLHAGFCRQVGPFISAWYDLCDAYAAANLYTKYRADFAPMLLPARHIYMPLDNRLLLLRCVHFSISLSRNTCRAILY